MLSERPFTPLSSLWRHTVLWHSWTIQELPEGAVLLARSSMEDTAVGPFFGVSTFNHKIHSWFPQSEVLSKGSAVYSKRWCMLSAQQMSSRIHSWPKVWAGGKRDVEAVETSAISSSSDEISYRGQTTKWADVKKYVRLSVCLLLCLLPYPGALTGTCVQYRNLCAVQLHIATRR